MRYRVVSRSSNASSTNIGFSRRSDPSKVGYLDATGYETGTDKKGTKANVTVVSDPVQSFSDSNESKEDDGTRELS